MRHGDKIEEGVPERSEEDHTLATMRGFYLPVDGSPPTNILLELSKQTSIELHRMTTLDKEITIDELIEGSYERYCAANDRAFKDELVMKGRAPYKFPISEVDARKHVEEMQEAHMVEALHKICT